VVCIAATRPTHSAAQTSRCNRPSARRASLELTFFVASRETRDATHPFPELAQRKWTLFAPFFNSIGNRHASSGIIGMSGREEEDEGAGAGGTATREGGIKRVSRPSVKAREGKKVPDTSQ
jgi:hypothetical protein